MRGTTQIRFAVHLLGAALVGSLGVAQAQQVAVEAVEAPRTLHATSTSEEAVRHFWAGVSDSRNVFFSRATEHFDRALELDSGFALARVLRARSAPGLTLEQRKVEVERGIAAMTGAPTAELVTALAFREAVAGNDRESAALFTAASAMSPGDPHLAHWAADRISAAEGQAKGVEAFRRVTQAFPNDAPPYNNLAYLLWATGDKDAALAAVKRYVELAPDQPNSHDSYGELVQWGRQYPDALTEYGRAVALDSTYSEGYLGLAEVYQVTGKGADARREIQRGIARAQSAPTRVGYARALGHSFLLDGMLKEGTDQLSAAARDAQTAARPADAAQAYRQMALANAFLGNGKAIASHLKAAEVGGADAPEQLAAVALAHGTAGNLATARKAAQQLASLAQTRTQFAGASRAANAVILLREKKPAEALAALPAADAGDALGRALRAECLAKTGKTAEAQTLRRQVLENPEYDLADAYEVLARMRASKIKA